MEEEFWTNTLVPGGARGVELKWKLILMDAWEDRIEFVREYWSRLKVITAWVMRLSHSWERKLGMQEASPAQR